MKQLEVKNISKSFKRGYKKNLGTLSQFLSMLGGKHSMRKVTILDDVSFNCNSGEIIALIGKNGSGKTTLLRIIAEIIKEDKGSVRTNGKVTSIMGLSAGVSERLTLLQNIFLLGSLFGMGHKTITDNLENIITYSELEEFRDTQLFQFSRGMIQRLVFSIALHTKPDILLIDEALAVGDHQFRQKVLSSFIELRDRGVTIILVSHNLEIIKKISTRCIWLKDGKIKKDGDVSQIIEEYKLEP